MHTQVEHINPSKAKLLLAQNTKNRPCNEKRIKNYASLMNDNKWHLTHQGICISKDGHIIDGQHRLKAVVLSGKTIPFNVTYNADSESFKYVDVGYTRTTGNIFAIEGIKNYKSHSAGVASYFRFCHSQAQLTSNRSSRVETNLTHDDYLKFYYKNHALLDKVHTVTYNLYRQYRILTESELYAFITHTVIDYGHEFDFVVKFLDSVYMNRTDSISNAPSLLFSRLIQNVTGISELKPRVKSALLIKAFNFFVKDKRVKVLKYTENVESFPTIEHSQNNI